MFQLATLTSTAETAAALARKAAHDGAQDPASADRLKLCARIAAALAAQNAFAVAGEILYGSGVWSTSEADAVLQSSPLDWARSQEGSITDMDALRSTL
jgi:hypothetical protein